MSETLGSDPVEEILSEQTNGSPDADPDDPDGDKPESVEKTRVTVALPEDLADRLRNAVYWTAQDVRMTDIATEGIRAVVEKLENERNDGEPFPERREDLKGGRPVEG